MGPVVSPTNTSTRVSAAIFNGSMNLTLVKYLMVLNAYCVLIPLNITSLVLLPLGLAAPLETNGIPQIRFASQFQHWIIVCKY